MIVDTSALIATFQEEEGHEPILAALVEDEGFIPTPVSLEFARVLSRRGFQMADIDAFLEALLSGPLSMISFDQAATNIAIKANLIYGSGLGTGGKLNLLDLMVYGTAKSLDRPILCTGRDFASTDIPIHPASRPV